MEKMFEIATRTKIRFAHHGTLSIEDLWDLPVGELDDVFKSLNAKLRQSKEESLLNERTNAENILELKIQLVKHIVRTKLEEEATRLNEKVRKDKKQKIMDIMSTKQDQVLQDKTVDELKEMLDELDA